MPLAPAVGPTFDHDGACRSHASLFKSFTAFHTTVLPCIKSKRHVMAKAVPMDVTPAAKTVHCLRHVSWYILAYTRVHHNRLHGIL